MHNYIKIIRIPLNIVAVVSLLVACSNKELTFPDSSPEQIEGAFVSVAQKIIVGESEYDADLGTLTVKENRNKANSRLITIPVVRIHAGSGQSNIPVFYLTGGPGMSNIAALENPWYLMPEHDVVIVGYRGVDGSSILDCPEMEEAFKGEGDLFSQNSMENIRKAMRSSAERLLAEGVDLNGYTILNVIEDNELARKALGYEKINLKSGSYGTRVAYVYGLLYPNNINRSVMQAVNPPGRFVWEPEVIDRQLRHFSNLWEKDLELSQKSNDLYGTIETVLNNIPDNWLMFPINKGKVKAVTFSLLFKEETAAMVFDSYIAAQEGDASGLALMTLAYDLIVPSLSTWGDLFSKAVSADFDPDRDYQSEMNSDDYPLGSPMSMLLWGPAKTNTWPIDQIPSKYDTSQYSDVETLMIGGSIDVGTPVEFATTQLLPYLKNGKQIILKECGHMDYDSKHSENVRLIVKSYYQTGIPDTSLNRYIPANYKVEWGFPIIAKISFGIFSFLSLIGMLLIYWIYKIIRGKYWLSR